MSNHLVDNCSSVNLEIIKKCIKIKREENKPILVLIGGGNSSGKTTMAREIQKHFLKEKEYATVVSSDHYSKAFRYDTPSSRLALSYNFRKPDSIDEELLANNLKSLLKGETIVLPEHEFFDFEMNSDNSRANKIIIAEGMHILQSENIRSLADLKVYMEMDSDLRLMNRITKSPLFGGQMKFGETVQESFEIWKKSVRPSEEKYIIPTKKYADLVITNNDERELDKKIKTIIDLIQ